jgi:glycosyltransferase 2 family protein
MTTMLSYLLRLFRRLAGSVGTRAAISAGLLGLVVSQIDLHTVSHRLARGHWGLFAAAAAAVFISFLLAAVRWHLFLRAAQIGRKLPDTIRAYLLGAFTNNFLPSQFGGDATRAWMMGEKGNRLRTAATVVVDRMTALVCLVLAAWLAFAANPAPVPGSLVAALALASAGLAVAVLVIGFVTGIGQIARFDRRFGGAARETIAGVRACLRSAVIARALALGLLFQTLVLLAVWLLARSISLQAPFSVLAVTVPTVLILSSLPVSIGGFGVREGTFVLLLGRAGVSSTDATVLSLLSAAAFAVASLPGALLLLSPVGSARPAQTQDGEQEGGEEDLDAGDQPGRRDKGDLALAECAETAGDPLGDDDCAPDDARKDERAAEE